MLYKTVTAIAIATASAQKIGTLKTERHPTLEFKECVLTSNGASCTSQSKEVTIDSNWRWLHKNSDTSNCYSGNRWDPSICPDVQSCAQNCVLEGADEEYTDTYGVKASGDKLDLQFVTQGSYSKNVGSRTYLMNDEHNYYMFHLKNREFSFDVDMSKMPCGLNGALYFVQMDQDGGKAKYSGNEGGAKYGTGYCDAQCPHDLKFINGEPNLLDWHPSATDPNAGTGKYGTCCVEMDIWEANSVSTAYTAHACDVTSQTRCDGISCGDNPDHRFDGHCDKNGCDFQTFRLGNETFYGPGGQFVLDTTQPMTVVTQFFTADGTDHGKLVEMRRFYRQGSKTIQTPSIVVGGAPHDSLTTPYCTAERDLFKDGTNFLQKGGLNSMDDAYDKGMVLVMSIWDDHDVNMLWLDSIYPPTGGPGSRRGTCSNTSGVPSEIEKTAASSHVTFSNIRFGPIGSTGATTVTHAAKPLLVELAANASAPWAQCTSASGCTTGWECTQHSTDFSFKQCTPSTALHKAFLATRPDAAALKAFMDKGTTHFAASGLPA